MGASAGSTVNVKLVDATTIINGDLNQLRTGEWADEISQHGDWHQDGFERTKRKISLERVNTNHVSLRF
ncbi:hypothetical protein SLS61_009938 [Didymella pomorum]